MFGFRMFLGIVYQFSGAAIHGVFQVVYKTFLFAEKMELYMESLDAQVFKR
jgi:hypothetical protein